MGKCPPGVICIENVTLLIVIIIGICVFCFVNSKHGMNKGIKRERVNENITEIGVYPRYGYTREKDDVLLNPYDPPLRDDRVFNVSGRGTVGVPINVSTQAVDTSYRQVGILTRINGKETILPLMGKPLFTNRDKWNFYTMNDKNNMIKLPITHKGKSCTTEYGCDNIYNGDTVYVEGYNDAFKATIYDNQVMKYIPFL